MKFPEDIFLVVPLQEGLLHHPCFHSNKVTQGDTQIRVRKTFITKAATYGLSLQMLILTSKPLPVSGSLSDCPGKYTKPLTAKETAKPAEDAGHHKVNEIGSGELLKSHPKAAKKKKTEEEKLPRRRKKVASKRTSRSRN